MYSSPIYKSLNLTIDPNNIIIGPEGITDKITEQKVAIEKSIQLAEEKLEELNNQILVKQEELTKLKETKFDEIEEYKQKVEQELDAKRAHIIEDSKNIIEVRKKEGYRKGYDEGYAFGINQVNEKTDEFIKTLESIINELEQKKQEELSNTDNDIFEIIQILVKKIIKKEIQTYPSKITFATLKDAINKISTTKEITVKINNKLTPKFEKLVRKIRNLKSGLETVNIIGDENITPGSVIIETEFGNIDAAIETQMNKLLNSIKDGSE